jgi:signal transduction histidine kinase
VNRSAHPTDSGRRPWRLVGALIAGLILTIAAAGVVAIVVNERVRNVTQRALLYDVEIEDEGDDIRVAVLDLRHHHRDIELKGTTEASLTDFDRAYADLLEEIREFERIGVTDPRVPQAARLRELAERYYAEFRPDAVLFAAEPDAFRQASAEGLRQLDALDDAADQIDGLGEQLTQDSLTEIDDAVTTGRFTLIALLGAVALVAAVLTIAAGRVFARLQVSYAREQATAQELARSLRTKTDFISDASHELRTPLTVILGNADIGLGTEEQRIQQEMLAEIKTETIRMSKLVDDLLFLARSDAGMPPLEKELVPARWLVTRLAKPATVLAQQRASCLTVEPGGQGYLEVDPPRIEQAVLILVDNASKHAPPGTCVTLTSRVQGDDLTIEVADEGPGIPSEELPLIFDRFYQVGTRRARKKDGSGLGLSIAKTIVEAHDGSIGVDSRLNCGTRMTIRLPLCATPESAVASEQQLVPV